LSDYFYVWMRRNLRSVFPDAFQTLLVPKEAELVADATRFHGDRDAANQHFETGLYRVFWNMRSAAARDYPLTVFYAFRQAEIEITENDSASISSTGWETMLEGLIQAGF